MMLSDVCLSVAYIGPKSRTERPRKTKSSTEVAHVTRDSDITFTVKRSKVEVTGGGAYYGGIPHSLFVFVCHHDDSKSCRRVLLKSFGGLECVTSSKQFYILTTVQTAMQIQEF